MVTLDNELTFSPADIYTRNGALWPLWQAYITWVVLVVTLQRHWSTRFLENTVKLLQGMQVDGCSCDHLTSRRTQTATAVWHAYAGTTIWRVDEQMQLRSTGPATLSHPRCLHLALSTFAQGKAKCLPTVIVGASSTLTLEQAPYQH